MEHIYLSTACLHGYHDYCSGAVGIVGPKVPGKCKFCPATCVCPHHYGEPVPAPDGSASHAGTTKPAAEQGAP